MLLLQILSIAYSKEAHALMLNYVLYLTANARKTVLNNHFCRGIVPLQQHIVIPQEPLQAEVNILRQLFIQYPNYTKGDYLRYLSTAHAKSMLT